MNKQDLFIPDVDELTVPLLRGGEVLVRSLSRAEVLHIGATPFPTKAEYEQYVLSLVMLDPVMSAEDVALWQQRSKSKEIEKVMDGVVTASGLGEGADKSDVQEVPDES